MNKTAWKRAGVALTAVAVVTGVAGCQDGDAKAAPETNSHGDVTKVITAAYEKTSAAKAAKVKMTMTMEGAGPDSGTAEMTGVQGWDPAVMDFTMKGSMLAAGGEDMPEAMRMIMLDQVMYVDMGAKQAAEMDGKRWMKLDMKAAVDGAGDKALQKQLTGGLDNMNQDPAQQLALLLDSPDLKHVGAEKINGMETQRYKGTITMEQMLKASGSSKLISKEDHAKLVEGMKKSKFKGYDTELWVNEDGYPARMDIRMTAADGKMHIKADYSDYGTKTAVQAPPAKDTLDLMEMLKGLSKDLGEAGAQG
ncbi:hypothetical protein H4W23_24010 [Streptomyces gardneri]|uniref:hypothetical protein n=1 Tax=Streptomyces gardneri TaxID=66892 RepID=UPI0006E2A419|nr:hypothetical protein [Streptomyces gardneri]QPK47387.1 hypothetical protein H4W23_24010 [Streptomyces gardneri]WRK38815.1 hypothetical protein U0M97_24110 [Streptomyces venezuelae]